MSRFHAPRSQKRKRTNDLTVIFALWGSTLIKAARKHVGEIDSSLPLKLLFVLMIVIVIIAMPTFFVYEAIGFFTKVRNRCKKLF